MTSAQIEIIEQIYEASANPETGWIDLIESFGRLFPEAKTVLGTYDDGSLCASRSASDLDSSAIISYGDHFASVNPIVPPLIKRQADTYFDADDLVDREEFLKSEIWNDFWRPLGKLERNVGVVLENRNGLFSTFCTHYPDIDETRESHETPGHLIRNMMPHLKRALRIQEQVEKASSICRTFFEMMDGNGTAAFLINARGVIKEQNDTAEDQLKLRDLLRATPDGKLLLSDAASDQSFQNAIRKSFAMEVLNTERISGETMSVVNRGGDFFCINVGPATGSTQLPGRFAIFREKFALVVVEPLGRFRRPDPQLLTLKFKLSAAETHLAISLFQGESLTEIATRKGLSVQTIRNQLRSIFQKTDTSRQAELVSLLSKLS